MTALTFALTADAKWIASPGEPARVLVRADIVTMTVFAVSIVFPTLSVAALVITLQSFRTQMNKAVRLHSILVAVSCVGISWFFVYWGLIGVRIWTRAL
jgi:succinate dehydrogenase/fumarate reductase cytochrome b subunit